MARTQEEGNSFGPELIRYTEVAIGYLGFFVVIFYPVSIISVWLRLLDTYGLAPITALYAVSLMPNTVVLAVSGGALFFSSVTAFVSAYTSSLVLLKPVFDEIKGVNSSKEEGGSSRRSKLSRAFNWFSFYIMLPLAGVFGPFWLLYAPVTSEVTRYDYVLFAAYALLTVLGGVLGMSLILPKRRDEAELPMQKKIIGVAIVYLCVSLASLSLASIQAILMPTVEFSPGNSTNEATLLNHTDGYWYVITEKGTVTAIKDNNAGDKVDYR